MDLPQEDMYRLQVAKQNLTNLSQLSYASVLLLTNYKLDHNIVKVAVEP